MIRVAVSSPSSAILFQIVLCVRPPDHRDGNVARTGRAQRVHRVDILLAPPGFVAVRVENEHGCSTKTAQKTSADCSRTPTR